VKIRLWGTEKECRAAAKRLMRTPGLLVLSVSEARADRGASRLVRVYVEARLDPPAEPGRATCTTEPANRPDLRASDLSQRMTRRRALPPGGTS